MSIGEVLDLVCSAVREEAHNAVGVGSGEGKELKQHEFNQLALR
jgi:hypothetical protein